MEKTEGQLMAEVVWTIADNVRAASTAMTAAIDVATVELRNVAAHLKGMK